MIKMFLNGDQVEGAVEIVFVSKMSLDDCTIS
jgi:hypothetical protein